MPVERMLKEETPSRVLVARVLAEAGIEYVFGISGGHTGRIISGLAQVQNQVRMVTVREELLAGVMAEVYGRLTRKPGVMIGQGPWVLGNGLIGTLEAFLSSSPMVLLTDFSDAPHFHLHAPYQQATGDYGSWDARRAFGGVTKQVMQAHEPLEAVQATQLAIKHALPARWGRWRSCSAMIRWPARSPRTQQPPLYPTRFYLPPPPPPIDAAQIDAAAERILAARKPIIIAGNGVRISQAYEELQQARRDRRAAGRHHRGRQGRVSGDASAGAGRVRHVRHAGGQCLHRRGRSGAGARLEAVAQRHRLGQRQAARPDAAELYPGRYRAAQRVVDLPGRAGRARRRDDVPRASCSRRCARKAGAPPRRGRAARRRPPRRARLFRRASL